MRISSPAWRRQTGLLRKAKEENETIRAKARRVAEEKETMEADKKKIEEEAIRLR